MTLSCRIVALLAVATAAAGTCQAHEKEPRCVDLVTEQRRPTLVNRCDHAVDVRWRMFKDADKPWGDEDWIAISRLAAAGTPGDRFGLAAWKDAEMETTECRLDPDHGYGGIFAAPDGERFWCLTPPSSTRRGGVEDGGTDDEKRQRSANENGRTDR